MTAQEIRSLAAVYREGLVYFPPDRRNRDEIADFNASELRSEYQTLMGSVIALRMSLSNTDEEGNQVPNPAATPEVLKKIAAVEAEAREILYAWRADWIRRKAERIAKRRIDIAELRMWVAVNKGVIFAAALEAEERKRGDDEQRSRDITGFA